MKYKKKVLKNGLRIITVPIKESQTAIAMVLVEAGSDYEEKNINGLSHFLEHMCFKGTKTRTNEQIGEELDSLGSIYNAFTGEQYTGYYARGEYRQLPKLLDVVADIYINPTFPEKDINIERGVIIEEINMYEDLPMRKVWEVWGGFLYGDQPAGRTIAGPKENILKFKRDDFVQYFNKHYVPNKTTVVIAGKINEKEVEKQVISYFGKLKNKKVAPKTKTKPTKFGGKVKIEYKKTDQSHIIIGLRAFDLFDKRNSALEVATAVLGKGFSSRLFKKMRDKLGMCYYVRAENLTSTDRGEFVVSIGVGVDRVEEAVKAIVEEFRTIKNELIGEKELNKAKNSLLGKRATSLETSEDWSSFYGFQELLHEKIKSPEEISKKIRAVTAKQIQNIFKKIIVNKNINMAIVGPHKDEKVLENLLSV